MKYLFLLLCCLFPVLSKSICFSVEDPLTDKTLVVWAVPANLTQRGGSALTIDQCNPDMFDAVVFGELREATWMPGSTGFARTKREQESWPKEAGGSDDYVQVAIVYAGRNITMYRDGKKIVSYQAKNPVPKYDRSAIVMFGPRHWIHQEDVFTGKIREARIYGAALSDRDIAALKPGKKELRKDLWAWWDFASSGLVEKTGKMNYIKIEGGARIENGALVLEKEGKLFASGEPVHRNAKMDLLPFSKNDPVPPQAVLNSRVLREKFLDDPWRPGYHFAAPEDIAFPGDPNGCFYANGRYHLMYLYKRTQSGFCWGHLSSHDLIHWRHHPDAIGPGDGDEGCFSGGGFLDEDGTAWLSYWMLWGNKGIGLAKSSDTNFDHWQKAEFNPIIPSTKFGITETKDTKGNKLIYGSADPSNIWKKDGKYYILTGSLCVLNEYGRKPDSPVEFRGDRLYLFESSDLAHWKYNGVFYQRNPQWTDESEDNMCPSFLPLPSSSEGGPDSGKHLLLFISHNKGCQYYIGTYDRKNDRFIPESHGRMTWADNTFFAPEALRDPKGRQIFWAWLLDNPNGETERGWSGVYGLPRSLWLGQDGSLRMAPVEELKSLRMNERSFDSIKIDDKKPTPLKIASGDSCELEITFRNIPAGKCGVKVRKSPAGEEETLLYYDRTKKILCMDSTRSGREGRNIVESAPLVLDDEPLILRVFIDKSVVEVYANDRQAICRRIYPTREDSLGIELFVDGTKSVDAKVKTWEIMPSNPY